MDKATVIHPLYLPFTREQLAPHFVNKKHLDRFAASAVRYVGFRTHSGDKSSKMSITKQVRLSRQIEKDERFWTTSTLKAIFDSEQFGSLLRNGFRDAPPIEGVSSWEECVGDKSDQRLYFEIAVTSPVSYRESLRARYLSETGTAHLVPYVVDAGRGKTKHEGATKLDAVFVNIKTAFCLMIESKVLSDVSCDVTFDPFRNQLARNIDVMMDTKDGGYLAPNAERRLLCLLTPEVFRDRPSTRYYGLLFHEYKRDHLRLAEHLPHRDALALDRVRPRLGWLTFEDCQRVCPGSCPWLPGQGVEP